MRKFASFAFALLATFALVGPLRAQEYAPLVQENVASVVRINLDKVDPVQLGAQAQKLGSAAIDFFAPDLENADEIKQTLPIANLIISQYNAEYVKPLQTAGVTNVYVVSFPPNEDDPTYPYVAIPVKDLSKEQIDKIRSHMKKLNQQFKSMINYRFERNGFFFMPIIPPSVDENDAKAYVKAKFGKMKAVDCALFEEGFKAVNADDAIASGVSFTKNDPETLQKAKDQILGLIDNADDDSDDDDEIKNAAKELVEYAVDFSDKIAGLVKYNAWSINVADLNVVSIIEANSEDDAKKYVSLVEGDLTTKLNEFLDVLEKKAVAETEDNEPDELSKEDIQGIFASIKEVAPLFMKFDVNGATLSWKLDEKFFKDNEGTFKGFSQKVGALVEKVQADVDVDVYDEDEEDEGDEE